MKTRLATLALPLLALAACAENNASVTVTGICAPPDDCTFSGECSAKTLQPIVIDASVAQQLLLYVEVQNQLPNNADPSRFRTNTNDAFVQEYEIEYPGTGLPTARGPIPGSATVPAAGTTVVKLPVVDQATRNIIAGGGIPAGGILDGAAEVKLHGVYGDTTSFTTGIFRVNVRACNGGCLDLCPLGTAPVSVACPPNAFGQTPAAKVECG